MSQVRLDPYRLASDSNDLYSVSRTLETALSSATSSLAGTGGGAGDDEIAQDFWDQYKPNGQAVLDGTAAAATLLRMLESSMQSSADAYQRASGAASATGAGSPITVEQGSPVAIVELPTVIGQGRERALGEFQEFLEDALAQVGVRLPDGDDHKLLENKAAWTSLQDDVRSAKQSLSSAMPYLSALDLPQQSQMQQSITRLGTLLGNIEDGAEQVGEMLQKQADQIQETWEQIQDFILQMAIEIALDIAISAALSFFTFGAAGIAGIAKVLETVLSWAIKIGELVEKLRAFTRAASLGVRLAIKAGVEGTRSVITGLASTAIVDYGRDGKFDQNYAALAASTFVGGGLGGAGSSAIFNRFEGAGASLLARTGLNAGEGAVQGGIDGVAANAIDAVTGQAAFDPLKSGVFGLIAGGVGGGAGGAIGGHGGGGAHVGSTHVDGPTVSGGAGSHSSHQGSGGGVQTHHDGPKPGAASGGSSHGGGGGGKAPENPTAPQPTHLDQDAPSTEQHVDTTGSTDGGAPEGTASETSPTSTTTTTMEAPATDAPATTEPAMDAPTTDAPTTDAPTTHDPAPDGATSDNSTTASTTTDASTTDVTTADAPTAEGPTADVPTTDEHHASVDTTPTDSTPGSETHTGMTASDISASIHGADAPQLPAHIDGLPDPHTGGAGTDAHEPGSTHEGSDGHDRSDSQDTDSRDPDRGDDAADSSDSNDPVDSTDAADSTDVNDPDQTPGDSTDAGSAQSGDDDVPPPHEPPHTGLPVPPTPHGDTALPDLTDINNEFRLPDYEGKPGMGEVDPARLDEWADAVAAKSNGALTAADVKGIYDYTGPGYDQMNNYLRDLGSTPTDIPGLETRITGSTDGVSHLQPHPGTTLRGTTFDQRLFDKLEAGKPFSDASFLSTSDSKSVASGFAHTPWSDEVPTPGEQLAPPKAIFFTVHGETGVDVGQLSMYRSESEVLFQRGTHFTVNTMTQHADGNWYVDMTEVPR